LGDDVNPVTLTNVETREPGRSQPRTGRRIAEALQQPPEDTTMAQDLVVSTEWLAEHLNDPKVRVVDMRGSVATRQVAPGVEQADYRGARDEYLAAHIPGAVYIDWTTDIIDPDDPVPVQIAPPARFAEAMATRGIGDDTLVVAVDHAGGQFATRLWWALKYYGHDNVRVLDRGWNAWIKEGRPVEAGEVTPPRAKFTPRIRPGLRVTALQLAGLLDHPDLDWQLLDARDPGQYTAARRRSTCRASCSSRLWEDFCHWTICGCASTNFRSDPTGPRSRTATEELRRPSSFSTWPGWAIPI
jgi:3-mercaptopyruvate sulfurtransferase SseA